MLYNIIVVPYCVAKIIRVETSIIIILVRVLREMCAALYHCVTVFVRQCFFTYTMCSACAILCVFV